MAIVEWGNLAWDMLVAVGTEGIGMVDFAAEEEGRVSVAGGIVQGVVVDRDSGMAVVDIVVAFPGVVW